MGSEICLPFIITIVPLSFHVCLLHSTIIIFLHSTPFTYLYIYIYPVSRRISLSPFLMLRHHSGTISGPSITFQAFPSHSITLLPFQSTPLLTPFTLSTFPPLRYHFWHHRFSLLFSVSLRTPFLSLVLCFYPYPISLRYSPFLSVPCFYPFILHFCLAVSWTKLLSNITINRHIVLSHLTVHLRFLSIYKPVYLGSWTPVL